MDRVTVKGKQVGYVIGDIFRKRVKASKHFLRKPPAIAFDKASIDIAKEYGATKIRVLDIEDDVIYSATMWDLENNGFDIDRGYGKQVAMLKSKWNTDCRICDDKEGE